MARPTAKAALASLTAPLGSVRSVRTDHSQVILTYDDGPDPASTPPVLEALRSAGATATFFVLMTRVRRHPGTLREVVAEGHEVALHGWQHSRLTAVRTSEIRSRAAASRGELEDAVGQPVRWFRPPYGAQSPRTWAAIRSAGLEPVMWSASTRDSRPGPPSAMLEAAMVGIQAGAIILCHDSQATAEDGAEPAPRADVERGTLARELTRRLAGQGLAAVSLSSALAAGGTLRKSAWFGGW